MFQIAFYSEIRISLARYEVSLTKRPVMVVLEWIYWIKIIKNHPYL